MASAPKMFPFADASPCAGAPNRTTATPPRATNANSSAREFSRSPKKRAPIGTTRNGVIAPMISALATVLCVAPTKNAAMLSPKRTPGNVDLRSFAHVGRLPEASTMMCQIAHVISIRQNATSWPGVSARFTSVEPSENITIMTMTAIAPITLALGRRLVSRRVSLIGSCVGGGAIQVRLDVDQGYGGD